MALGDPAFVNTTGEYSLITIFALCQNTSLHPTTFFFFFFSHLSLLLTLLLISPLILLLLPLLLGKFS